MGNNVIFKPEYSLFGKNSISLFVIKGQTRFIFKLVVPSLRHVQAEKGVPEALNIDRKHPNSNNCE